MGLGWRGILVGKPEAGTGEMGQPNGLCCWMGKYSPGRQTLGRNQGWNFEFRIQKQNFIVTGAIGPAKKNYTDQHVTERNKMTEGRR